MASVIIPLRDFGSGVVNIQWIDDVAFENTFALSGNSQRFDSLRLFDESQISPQITAGQVALSLIAGNDRFTAAFEATGRIIIEASDGETLEVMIADADMTEPYSWVPTNPNEVIAFVTHVRALTDKDATMTLTDDPIGPPPFGAILYTATDSDGRTVAIDIDWTLST